MIVDKINFAPNYNKDVFATLWFRCHISNTYMGALSYADDITLISPSLYGLNRMLDICNKFAIDNFIKFNSKKTICIKYGEDVRVSEQVFMNGRLLSWHSEISI